MTVEELSTIYERMKETIAREAGYAPTDGGEMMLRLYALAAEVQSLLVQADWVLAQSFPQTAQGTYLDYHAQTRALTRGAATCAEGTLRFFAEGEAASDYEIPRGTVCMSTDSVKFETTQRAVLSAGEHFVDVPGRAVEPGVTGNVAANAATVLSAVPAGVVRCTNPTPFSGGADAEDDETLRQRILASYRRLPNGANAAYYEQEAMRFEGVASARAVGRARGIGTVDVYVSTRTGTPSEELLAAIRAALEEKREIAVDLRVLAPTIRQVDVAAELRVAEGYTFEEVSARAEALLRAYFNGERLGETVMTAKLNTLLFSAEGVANCHLLSPETDVAASATELPVLRNLTLTEMT